MSTISDPADRSAATPLVAVSGVTHRFASGSLGLDNVSLEIRGDELLLVAGPNGSGKTVLMYHLLGLLEPTAGEIRYRGVPIGDRIDEVRRRIGIVFQNPETGFLGHTVAEDVRFALDDLSEEETERRVTQSLSIMGIPHLADGRPPYLSGGEQRKAALASLLAREPEILILDEPFIGLDLPGVRSILRAILDLRARRHTIVVVTHDVEKVLAHADRVAVMYRGRVAEVGSPADVASHLDRYDVRSPTGPIDAMTWLRQ